jgi:hypothetical protein
MRSVYAFAAVIGLTSVAMGGLTKSYQFNGKGNWSISGIGSTNTNVGNLTATIPAGSTVQQAYLYSSTYAFSSTPTVPDVVFDGTAVNGAAWTALTTVTPSTNFTLKAYRRDVTAQVAAKVGSGGGTTNFPLVEINSNSVDGGALVVVYSNPADSERTIALLDGGNLTTGDTFVFSTTDPLPNPATTPGFEALVSLGIGFSAGNAQFSQIDVNNRRLTSSAGDFDDGVASNGALFTIGESNDDPANPTDPISNNKALDDEYYNLALGNASNATPYITAGITDIVVRTLNPSNDDLIFFAGINITAEGTVVPEPTTLAAIALAGLTLGRRRR